MYQGGESEDDSQDESGGYFDDEVFEFQESGDSKEGDGESLYSKDTLERGGHVDSGDGDNASEDESYNLGNSSDTDNEPLVLKDVNNLVEETEEHFDMNEECIVAQESTIGVFVVGITFQSAQSDICDVPEICEEPMEGATSFSDVITAPSSMVLPSHGVTTGTNSTMLSFVWALANHRMTLRDNGLYYDLEGVKYRRVGEEGNYTYE